MFSPGHPGDVRRALDHLDTLTDRADEAAQVATHAGLFDHPVDIDFSITHARHVMVPAALFKAFTLGTGCCEILVYRRGLNGDRLMRPFLASNVTETAVNALLLMDLGNHLVPQIEIAPRAQTLYAGSLEMAQLLETLLHHPEFQAGDHLLHNSKAVVHGCRADLDAAGAQQHVLYGVLPSLNAADS